MLGDQVQQPVSVCPGFLHLGLDFRFTQLPVTLSLAVHLVKDGWYVLSVPLTTPLLKRAQRDTDRLPHQLQTAQPRYTANDVR